MTKSIIDNDLILDLQPFSIVTKPGFLRKYQQYHPQYDIPSATYFSEQIDNVYEKIKTRVKDQIAEHNPKTSTISLDGWSAKHHGYLGFNRHYIHDFKRYKYNLACTPFDQAHTSENIWIKVKNVLDEWEFIPYLALRDSAQNLKSAFLQDDDCNVEDIPDILHSLQLIVQKHAFDLESVKNLMKNVKKFQHIHHIQSNFRRN